MVGFDGRLGSPFSFLAPAISGSSNDYPGRAPNWPLYTATPYKVYLQQVPIISNQTDVTTRVEAGFRFGILGLKSGRKGLLLS